MEQAARSAAKALGAEVKIVVLVPGCFDMPLAARKLLERKDIDAVIALGAVVKGKTGHDQVVVHAAAASLAGLAVQFGKPVTFGVIGPDATWKQAVARQETYARHAVQAAVELLREIRKI